MAYAIHIYEEDIVFVRFYAQSNLQESEKARDETLQICRDSGITLILADWREAKTDSDVSTMDLYEFGCTWPSSQASPSYRIATVQTRDLETQRNIEFVDTVANNRCIDSKIFEDVEEAINWLRARK